MEFLEKEIYDVEVFIHLVVVHLLGNRSGGPGSIPGTARFSGGGGKETVVGLERSPLSLLSTT
jgi:hypothetical protein